MNTDLHLFPALFTIQNRPRTLRELLTNRYFVVITACLLYFVLDAPINVSLVSLELVSKEHSHFFYLLLKYSSVTIWSFMTIYCVTRVSFARALARTRMHTYIRAHAFDLLPLSLPVFLAVCLFVSLSKATSFPM